VIKNGGENMDAVAQKSNAFNSALQTNDMEVEYEELSLQEAYKIITDKYCAKILMATDKEPRSAVELSFAHRIPIAACYRRIRLLSKAGILICADRVPSIKGKNKNLYASMLSKGSLILEGQKFRVEFVLKTGNIKEYEGGQSSLKALRLVR